MCLESETHFLEVFCLANLCLICTKIASEFVGAKFVCFAKFSVCFEGAKVCLGFETHFLEVFFLLICAKSALDLPPTKSASEFVDVVFCVLFSFLSLLERAKVCLQSKTYFLEVFFLPNLC